MLLFYYNNNNKKLRSHAAELNLRIYTHAKSTKSTINSEEQISLPSRCKELDIETFINIVAQGCLSSLDEVLCGKEVGFASHDTAATLHLSKAT